MQQKLPEKKRLSRYELVLADDTKVQMVYALDEIFELGEYEAEQKRVVEAGGQRDHRYLAHIIWLGLRRLQPEMTVEQVAGLLDAANLDYYVAVMREATGQGNEPAPPPMTETAAPTTRPNGADSAPSREYNSASVTPNSGS